MGKDTSTTEQTALDPRPRDGPAAIPIRCLGEVFPDEEAHRSDHRERFVSHLEDPEFRRKEGFPQGSLSAIEQLAHPPFYTPCPNPFLTEFVQRHSRPVQPGYHREPYRGELRSSARHPVYSFHPYHTKVPPQVIRTLIEHYTDPGDLVLDAFAGTGMTGVAARESGRHAVLIDLCPISGFIASVNTQTHDWAEAQSALERIMTESETQWGHLYEVLQAGISWKANYYVWSDIFTCPECACEFPFFPHGVIHHGEKVETLSAFPCPGCGAELTVRRVQRVIAGDGQKKKALVWVNAGEGRDRLSRPPDAHDLDLAQTADAMQVPNWHPTDPVDPAGYSARLAQLGEKGITDVSRFLSKRNLIVFADLWARVEAVEDPAIRNLCRATLTSIFTVISERQGYFGGGGGMSGNLYMPIVRMEKNVYDVLRRKVRKLEGAEKAKADSSTDVIVSTQSATSLTEIPASAIDYIYTDPPFGANIIYSEMNLILEGWLRVRTNPHPEAVIDQARGRTFDDYAGLMRQCFREYHRVLKPGRWITVEFHNTQAAIWNLIQSTLIETGFVVAQVGVLDKGSTTILTDIRPGAAKYDLLMSAYKPTGETKANASLRHGSIETVWEFVTSHLRQLPLHGDAEISMERKNHMLFDRMVAFHVIRRMTVPISAAAFYQELARRYPERDGMYFLPGQTVLYDQRQA